VELQVTPQDVLRQLPAALAAMDQPTVDGINSFLVSGVARESGLTVALSGLGGDELFAGYDTFRRVPRLERAQQLIPAPVGRGLAAIARPALGPAGGAKLSRWLAGRDAPESAHELVRELFSPAARHALVPGAEVSRDLRHLETPADPTDAVSFLELERYTRNVLLRDTDVMSMARGLEVRVPLLDDRLVSWVAGLPGELKRSGSGPKPLLTGALEGMLPRAVVQRKKMGFTLPFALWLHGELRATVERALLDSDCGGAAAAALNGAAVADVWRQFQAGRAHWSRPWSLYVLKMWGEANTVR
jgi:asparagine synthase (glutamine-hydrolysing)